MTFKARHREMQEIAREIAVLQKHNREAAREDSGALLLLISEAAVTCLALERFLRIVLGSKARDSHTLRKLLATSRRLKLIKLSGAAVERAVNIRNTLLHANYGQAASAAGCADVSEYFRTRFRGEIETMFKILEHVMKQIDPESGLPRARPSDP